MYAHYNFIDLYSSSLIIRSLLFIYAELARYMFCIQIVVWYRIQMEPFYKVVLASALLCILRWDRWVRLRLKHFIPSQVTKVVGTYKFLLVVDWRRWKSFNVNFSAINIALRKCHGFWSTCNAHWLDLSEYFMKIHLRLIYLRFITLFILFVCEVVSDNSDETILRCYDAVCLLFIYMQSTVGRKVETVVLCVLICMELLCSV